MLKLSVFIVLAIAICGSFADIEDNEIRDSLGGVQLYESERTCAMIGGLCVHREDCVVPTSKTGLCPLNQHLGVECCYELPIKAAPCREHLGICMNYCNRFLQRPGNDCENGQVCCVLVN